MGVLQEGELTIRTRILEEKGKGAILEIAFKGLHDHTWPHGKRMNRFVAEEVRKRKPAALMFNFVEYRYDFGNEIADPILAALRVRKRPAILPFAIIATGATSRSLKNLLGLSNWNIVFEYEFFEAVEAGFAFLRRALSQAGDAPGPVPEDEAAI
jgi:hypothetical protein